MTQMHNPPHPGAVLQEWLTDISVTEAAGISAEMDLRLSKALSTTPGFWYGMQADYDMWQAQRHFRSGKVRTIVKPMVVAAED
jgi:antitoxin HigA-1